MKIIAESALFCLLLVSCGKPIKNSPAPAARIYHTSLSSTPLFLNKQTIGCLDQTTWQSEELNLFLYLVGQIRIETRDFKGLIDSNLVRSSDKKIIAVTEYGEDFEYLYEQKSFKHVIYSAPKNVDLCPNTLEYAQNTVESAALNTAFFIKQTHDSFAKANVNTYIPPVTLKIAPRIRHTVIQGAVAKTLYLTDNAYYQPGLKTITFLPGSLEAKKSGFWMNFWEIPMVAAHEYGHHIFNTIMGSSAISGLQKIDLCFDNRVQQNVSPVKKTERKINVNTVLLAFNEGFADLISFYTLGKSERSLNGVKCMEASRDAAHSHFYNGTFKNFSSEALESFFSDRNDSEGKTCEDVDYQDIHTIGAIFAHNADRFLSLYTDSNEQKLQVLHDWVQSLKLRHSKISSLSPQDYFEDIFELFLRLSLKKFDKKFDRSSCDEVNRIYPGLVKQFGECS